jgi:hypothetical protein
MKKHLKFREGVQMKSLLAGLVSAAATILVFYLTLVPMVTTMGNLYWPALALIVLLVGIIGKRFANDKKIFWAVYFVLSLAVISSVFTWLSSIH